MLAPMLPADFFVYIQCFFMHVTATFKSILNSPTTIKKWVKLSSLSNPHNPHYPTNHWSHFYCHAFTSFPFWWKQTTTKVVLPSPRCPTSLTFATTVTAFSLVNIPKRMNACARIFIVLAKTEWKSFSGAKNICFYPDWIGLVNEHCTRATRGFYPQNDHIQT